MVSKKDNAQTPAEQLIPEQLTIEALREAAAGCLVGEQPGDREDVEGRPFVGPAGRILDEALDAAGIRRADVYLTNAVKHFRWERRGKRRLHMKPSQVHVRACRPWLQAELESVRPRLLVLLGATAAQSVMGPAFKVTQQRGKVLASPLGLPVLATVHPSSVLRSPDAAARREAMEGLIADLKAAAGHLRDR